MTLDEAREAVTYYDGFVAAHLSPDDAAVLVEAARVLFHALSSEHHERVKAEAERDELAAHLSHVRRLAAEIAL